MSLPDQPPRISKWFFLLSDALLIAVAAFIAHYSRTPLSVTVVLAIVGCVAVGALITAAAFVADYTRKQDEALDDRQRALESLARTITTSAEQISIAAGGLHEIAELAQKNLRHAEKLPHQLQDKIAEFQVQLANANDVEKEELEKEVAALRTTESERLDSISDKIAKATAEWTKLEVAAQKRLTAAADMLAKAQADAGALDTKLAATLAALGAKLATFEAAAKNVLVAPAAAIIPAGPPAEATPAAPAETSATDSPKTDSTAHPPKRPRKPRREESPAEETPAAPAASEPSATPGAAISPAPEAEPGLASEIKVDEPAPIPSTTIPEIAPVAPDSAEPFAGNIGGALPAETPPAPTADASAAEPAKPARKRAPKKPAPEVKPDTSLSLDITETPAVESAEVHERVRTSDGATRLIVTAYIGIGNRLFIRGEGPGLSWEKGVPLQFVSIGKWRWETGDAAAPVKFKLYKNDDTECAALGTQSLDPGQQQEVTAAF